MEWILTTKRLALRQLNPEDASLIAPVLSNPQTMYAWEHGFSQEETAEWIQRQIERYQTDGYAYWCAIEQTTGRCIGLIGLLREALLDCFEIGLGYIIDKHYWGQGYGYEGAQACLQYAFEKLSAAKVIAEIRPSNHASCRLAEKLGMKIESQFIKRYNGQDMLHFIYSIDRPHSI